MLFKIKKLVFDTKGHNDIRDITSSVEDLVSDSGIQNGVVVLFVPGSTAGVTTIEYESGVLNDLVAALERLAPESIHYFHDVKWGDGNGYAHIRSALLGPSLSVPVVSRRLQLGTWQQIVFIDFDNRPRKRNLLVEIIGE